MAENSGTSLGGLSSVNYPALDTLGSDGLAVGL